MWCFICSCPCPMTLFVTPAIHCGAAHRLELRIVFLHSSAIPATAHGGVSPPFSPPPRTHTSHPNTQHDDAQRPWRTKIIRRSVSCHRTPHHLPRHQPAIELLLTKSRVGATNRHRTRTVEHQDHRCATRRHEESTERRGRQGRERSDTECTWKLRAAICRQAVCTYTTTVL
jgi:hypothetical protein